MKSCLENAVTQGVEVIPMQARVTFLKIELVKQLPFEI